MARRMRGSGIGFGARPRVQASPLGGGGRPQRGGRATTLLGWVAAAGVVALVAFFVGRAGSEVGIASPVPSPTPGPLTIAFGTALDPASGEAANRTDRFREGDPIAYSVTVPVAAGGDSILVEIARIEEPDAIVVQPPSRQGIDGSSRVIAFTFAVPTGELLRTWGPGDYLMRTFYPGATSPFATGRFTLVATPAAS